MKRNSGAVITIFLTIIMLFVYYSYQIINARNITYSQWGDGRKNFYTLAYYLRYDSGTHFTGMNYPYGENVVFTDNQPIMAWILKGLSKLYPSLLDNIHAFLAGAIFFSVVISAFFLYKFLIEFEVNELHAALFGSLIALLSPQITRLHGDFSLGYTCFLPILLYLLVNFFKTNGDLKIFGLIIFALTFFSFIHVYYLAIGGFFILMIAFFVIVTNVRQIKKRLRLISLLLLSATMPVLIFKVYLLLTDNVNDRPNTPWGFVVTRSKLTDIFLHPSSFTGELVAQLFPKAAIEYGYEGAAYIGLVPMLTLLVVSVLSIAGFSKLKAIRNRYLLNVLMLSAMVALLFAMAFPFSVYGLEKYYNVYMPAAVKQFRISGRFSWVFYYTATLYSAVFLSYLFRYLTLKKYYVLFVLSVLLVYTVWFIEMNMISNKYKRDFKNSSYAADETTESEKLKNSLRKAGKNIDNFQAIFFCPFFVEGSEKLAIESISSFQGMNASLFTGLPLIDSQLSRTSESQAFSIANLLSSDYLRKDVIRKFPSQKPLLLLKSGHDISPPEWKVINRAHFLFEDGVNRYYELPLSAFSDSTGIIKRNFVDNRTRLIVHNEYQSLDSADNVIVNRFENQPRDCAVFGHGAASIDHGETYFYYDTLPAAKDSTVYEMSIWCYSDDKRAEFPLIHMSQIDVLGNEISTDESNPKYSTNTFGKWVRGQIDFVLYNRKNKIHLFANDYGSYDEVMIRPKGTNVVTGIENDSTFMYNNFPIR